MCRCRPFTDPRPTNPGRDSLGGAKQSLGCLLRQIAADVLVRHRHVHRAESRDAVEGPLAVVGMADGVRLRLPAEGGIAREQEVYEWRQEPQFRVGVVAPQIQGLLQRGDRCWRCTPVKWDSRTDRSSRPETTPSSAPSSGESRGGAAMVVWQGMSIIRAAVSIKDRH